MPRWLQPFRYVLLSCRSSQGSLERFFVPQKSIQKDGLFLWDGEGCKQDSLRDYLGIHGFHCLGLASNQASLWKNSSHRTKHTIIHCCLCCDSNYGWLQDNNEIILHCLLFRTTERKNNVSTLKDNIYIFSGRAQDGISLLARRYRISTKKSYNTYTESLNAWGGRDLKVPTFCHGQGCHTLGSG